MGLRYENLDQETRRLMLEEIEMDGDDLYLSNYLNNFGRGRWPILLREAAARGTDDDLAAAVNGERCLKGTVERRTPRGGTTMAAVPVTAGQTLAESQFNMYYIRALSRRAIDEGAAIEVYRAKRVENPRPESEQMIGRRLDAAEVLDALRRTHGVEPPVNIPMPNTGITVRLVKR